MPLMLFINEVMVRIWELLDLAPKVLKRLSSLVAAIFEPAFARILSDVNTIAGSVYDHVPITFSLVACFLLEKIYVRLDTASSPEPPSTLFSTSLMSCA